MSDTSNAAGGASRQSGAAHGLVRTAIGFLLFVLLVPALLFLTAGTLAWVMAWAYVVAFVASIVVSRLLALKRSPDLLRERARFTEAEGAKPWDRALVVVVGLMGPLLMVAVAGLDHRLEVGPSVPIGGQVAAGLALVVGYGLAVWAMAENRFFSAVVRIQTDRGHEVVSSGPYRLVRHPSYAGGVLSALAFPFMLDALWALVPAVAFVVAVGIRTALEDRTLMAELPGYASYAQRTKFRLVPWIW